MSGKQTAVLWMGLILIVLNLDWGALKKIIFTGGSSSGGSPGINIPVPGLPGTGGITIPVGAQKTPAGSGVTVM